jgi:hypothetical protein
MHLRAEVKGGQMKIFLIHIKLDADGFDSKRKYWGNYQPVFWYHGDTDDVTGYLRANDVECALAQIRKQYPESTPVYCVPTWQENTK